MAPHSAHVRKRQYQPSNQSRLDSFFDRDGSDSPSHRSRSPMSPPVPADTQAALLTVGMRIRKSVPEGYKTHKTIGMDGFPFPSSAPPASSAPARPTISPTQTRELMPFCGLHKTGGWAAQGAPSSSAPPGLERDEDGDDDMPELSTSQNSIVSSQNSSGTTLPPYKAPKKRTYEEEMDDFDDAILDEMEAADGHMSQPARPMARMKSSTQKTVQSHGVRIFGSDDFEEATFLVPEEDMDMEQ
ncbi:Hypothetical predicted protein [Lecanosticta acicola]|uniref:Uncharacterized protein n=1 Tax=Lecanosticta acicola TaxID=111012 RepID=A0AAI8YTP1_9PEZI|nr:Hypothetical predicted protein [Lecanosticta acicola]